LFVDALGDFQEEPVTVPELIEHLLANYPNVFLNLFCTQRGREKAREFIERGDLEGIYADEATWKDLIRTNVLFNFVHQLRHAGILAPETSGHGRAIATFDPDAKPWHVERIDV
jgi:hypothetical protein